ncbi:hypothetical protein [Williamsia serinedens]|uniref:Uncharacterized protein n=1 Tax=Williamsia serinedens TaxID=391736 RepID=A0ABT1H530_9NOCA|nr:hypothetical protein [Williamsia serinedens]MCP2160868.1 hypothetical protein [Williamsia serinedens]
MTDPNSAIPDHLKPAPWVRYEGWRVRLYEKNQAKNAHRLVGMRNRRGARILACGVLASLAVLVVASVMSFVTHVWFFIPFVVGLIGVFVFLKLLGIVTGNIAEAPVASLDELQLAKRNSARSIGYLAVFSLMFIPYLALVLVGSSVESVSGHTVYGFGVLLITLMLVGTCSPTLLLAWWTEDPDPEDFADTVDTATDEATVESTEPPRVTADASPSRPRDDDTHFDPPAPGRW